MLNLSPTMRVFVCPRPTDMRRSFDGLCGMAENLMRQSPLSGHLFPIWKSFDAVPAPLSMFSTVTISWPASIKRSTRFAPARPDG